MAFSNGAIWHIWSTGGALGGGFVPTNANMATDLTTDANTANTSSPVVSSASYNFAAGDVGAKVFIQSGTNWTPGWYTIASVASNKATLTASVGSAVLYGTSSTGLNYQRPNGLNTAAGCATTGTPTGGVWTIDYSQQTAAGITYTDMVIDGTTNTIYTSAGNPVGKNIIGNVINVTSGTGFTVQRVEVISTSGTQATVDKSLGTLSSTGGNGVLGGAISTLATGLGLSFTAGNKIFIKATATYTVSSTVAPTASVKGDATNGRISVEGFTTYPGERDGRPVWTSATNSVALFTPNDSDYWEFKHLKFTHTAATRGNAFGTPGAGTTPIWIIDCICDGCLSLNAASTSYTTIHLQGCEILNTTSSTAAINFTNASSQAMLFGCDIHDNAGDGIRMASNGAIANLQDCIFDTNAIGVNLTGTTTGGTVTAHGCVFVDNTSDGIKIAANSGTITLELQNNVFYGNGGYGIDNLDEQAVADANIRINRNNAYGSNSSGNYLAVSGGRGEITLTADPFTNRAGRDFSPNSTAGGGAALKNAGYPGAYPGGTTTNYQEAGIGATSSGAASSGGFVIGG